MHDRQPFEHELPYTIGMPPMRFLWSREALRLTRLAEMEKPAARSAGLFQRRNLYKVPPSTVADEIGIHGKAKPIRIAARLDEDNGSGNRPDRQSRPCPCATHLPYTGQQQQAPEPEWRVPSSSGTA